MNLRKTAAFAAALLLLLSSGCGMADAPAPSAPVTPAVEIKPVDSDRVYTIPIGDWASNAFWVIDGNGNEIAVEGSTCDYTEFDIVDLMTGEVRYIMRERHEITRDEQRYPQTVEWRSLCDLEGNTLIDWEKATYQFAFGEYIIRQVRYSLEDVPGSYHNHSSLYHVPTGRESFVGVFDVFKLENGNFLLTDIWRTTLGIINEFGEVVSGFPMPKEYYNAMVWNGYITANNANPNVRRVREEGRYLEYLLDSDLNELFTAQLISLHFGHLRGNYFFYRNVNGNGVLHPEQGVVFSVTDASVEYFDGELAIVREGEYRGHNPINAALVTSEHRELAKGFSWLVPDGNYDDIYPSDRFIGILNNRAVLIDREGRVIASSEELPNARRIDRLSDGLYTYYIEDGNFYGSGLLGPDLELIVPVGRYTYFDSAPGLRGDEGIKDMENILIQAHKEIGRTPGEPGNLYRSDILDHTGRVIIDNITYVYDIGPDRIALRRGFDIGLMDWNGNWVVRRTVFSNRLND